MLRSRASKSSRLPRDKLSALAWRVRVRRRGEPKDDPTIRHFHDLAALEPALESAAKFRKLVLAAVAADVSPGGEKDPPTDPIVICAGMLQRLETEPLSAQEYEDFVRQVSFAASHEIIGFTEALASCRRLVASVLEHTPRHDPHHAQTDDRKPLNVNQNFPERF